MVKFAAFIGAALVARSVYAAPRPKPDDSSIGDEVAVSAPNGIPITDTAELSSQLAAEASTATSAIVTTTDSGYSSSYTSSAYVVDTTSTTDSSVAYVTTTSAAYQYTSSAVYDSSSVVYDSSSMVYDSSSVVYDLSSVVYDTTSTMMDESTSTSTADVSYNTMSYGSGSSSWGSNGYDSCVQQCVASFGAPPSMYTPSASSSYGSGSDSGSSGSGVTHTIIVAPSQGVLRYVPFATNASVGDTIKFMWNANMHTVTKSSQLELCNKTTDAPFTSGVQNKSFVFTQVVNSTDPTFFYCGVPSHCQKGMFGIINPPSALTAPTSVDSMMPSLINNSSDVAAMSVYTNNMTQGSNGAASWGGSIDMASMPTWSYNYVAENVMFARSFLAANPDVLKDDGSVDLSAANGAPLMIPQDLPAVLAASSSSAGAPSGTSGTAASQTSASSNPSATVGASTNGARGPSASTALAVIAAFGAVVFSL